MPSGKAAPHKLTWISERTRFVKVEKLRIWTVILVSSTQLRLLFTAER
jgi:hypothetical protein